MWTHKIPSRHKAGTLSENDASAWRAIGNNTHQLATQGRRHLKGLHCTQSMATSFWKLHRNANKLLSKGDGEATVAHEVQWLNELTGLYNDADSAQAIPPASIAKLAAKALKRANDLDEIAAKERRQEFRDWLDGGSTFLHNGAPSCQAVLPTVSFVQPTDGPPQLEETLPTTALKRNSATTQMTPGSRRALVETKSSAGFSIDKETSS